MPSDLAAEDVAPTVYLKQRRNVQGVSRWRSDGTKKLLRKPAVTVAPGANLTGRFLFSQPSYTYSVFGIVQEKDERSINRTLWTP
jgi:hypothetical protein